LKVRRLRREKDQENANAFLRVLRASVVYILGLASINQVSRRNLVYWFSLCLRVDHSPEGCYTKALRTQRKAFSWSFFVHFVFFVV
jgi:hypothetical protein